MLVLVWTLDENAQVVALTENIKPTISVSTKLFGFFIVSFDIVC